jgi:hypothetical protein
MHDSSSVTNDHEPDKELVKKFRRAVMLTYDTLEKMGLGDNEGLDELGALGMAHRHLKGKTTSQGFARLWEMGKLHLSIEALVLRTEFESLFTDAEREIARGRLINKGYDGIH